MLSRYLYRRSAQELRKGRLAREQSQRSNSNSHSTNTCSTVCSMPPQPPHTHQPLRYLETDLVHLKTSKRPLVVSFRRIPRDYNNQPVIQTHNSMGSSSLLNLNSQNNITNDLLPNKRHTLCTSSADAAGEKHETLLYLAAKEKLDLYNTNNCQNKKIQLLNSSKNLYNFKNTSCNNYQKILNDHQDNYNEDVNEMSNESFSNSNFQLDCKTTTNIIRLPINESRKHSFSCDCTCCSYNSSETSAGTICKYKSPYDSPELSADSKHLEQSLQIILGKIAKPKK